MIPLSLKRKSHTDEHQGDWEVVSALRCSSRLGTGRCSAHLVSLHFRQAHIFGNTLPNTDLVTIRTVKLRSPHPTSITCLMFPQLCLLKASRSPLWTFWATQEKSVRNMLSQCTWSISNAYNGVFPNRIKTFRFIRSSVLIAEWPEKGGVNKIIGKNAKVAES